MVYLRLLFVVLGLLLAIPSDSLAGVDDDGDDASSQVDDHRDHPDGDGPLPLELPPLQALPDPVVLPVFADLRQIARTIAVRFQSRVPGSLPAPRLHRVQHRSGGDSADGDGAARHV